MFDYPGGGHEFLTKEEREFAECFARTFSVKAASRAAGFDPRTAFARASRLLEKDEIRALVAEYAASFGAGAAKGAQWETAAAAAAGVSEESGRLNGSGRSGGNGRSGTADASENGGAGMAGGSDEAGAARQSEACVTKAAVGDADEEVFGEALGRGASDGDGALYGHGASDRGGVSIGHGASDRDCAERGTESDRIIREYEKIAFADASLGEIKVSDKLRALDQYRAMCERRNDGGEISLVVNYDYGE